MHLFFEKSRRYHQSKLSSMLILNVLAFVVWRLRLQKESSQSELVKASFNNRPDQVQLV